MRSPNVRKSVELQKFLQYIVCGTSGLQFFISAALKTWRISFYRMRRTHGQNACACILTKMHAHAFWSRDTLHGYIRRTKAQAKEEREPSYSLFLFPPLHAPLCDGYSHVVCHGTKLHAHAFWSKCMRMQFDRVCGASCKMRCATF